MDGTTSSRDGQLLPPHSGQEAVCRFCRHRDPLATNVGHPTPCGRVRWVGPKHLGPELAVVDGVVRYALKHQRGRKLSDLQIARHVGVSEKTVAKCRAELESRSEVPNVSTRTDSKGRTQPARKSKNTAPVSTNLITDELRRLPEHQRDDCFAAVEKEFGAELVVDDLRQVVDRWGADNELHVAPADNHNDAHQGSDDRPDGDDPLDAPTPPTPARRELYASIDEYIDAAVEVHGAVTVADWLEMQVERLRGMEGD